MTSSNDIVTLDVGGHIYRTTISTLTRYPDSMLGAMFGGDFGTLQDDKGRYFIDRDGTLFRHVLNFLRTNQLTLPEDFKELPLLEIEADFYQIQPLIEALVSYKARLETDPSLETGPGQETSPCDVIFLYMSPIGRLKVCASSTEVKDMVNDLKGSHFDHQSQFHNSYLPALIARLHDHGFTVQNHVTRTENSQESKWVLVRKPGRNSPDS